MNLKDMRKMIKAGHFIEGIYNYCDRWCQRCPFTSRCLLYAQDRGEADGEPGPESVSFWKKLESRLRDTRRELLMSLPR